MTRAEIHRCDILHPTVRGRLTTPKKLYQRLTSYPLLITPKIPFRVGSAYASGTLICRALAIQEKARCPRLCQLVMVGYASRITRHLLVNNELAMMMALVALAGCGNRNKAVHHEDDMATTRKTRIFVGPKILCDSPHHFPH
jgi:hypothetical protein